MSFRPTISVYLDGQNVSLGYYRNWLERDLFYEAVALAAVYGTPSGIRMLRRKLDSADFIPGENEELEQQCSEMPIAVDLDTRAIYLSYGQLSPAELRTLPVFGQPLSFQQFCQTVRLGRRHGCLEKLSPQELTTYRKEYDSLCLRSRIDRNYSFSRLLSTYRIPFDAVDLKQVLRLYRARALRAHLSKGTLGLLQDVA